MRVIPANVWGIRPPFPFMQLKAKGGPATLPANQLKKIKIFCKIDNININMIKDAYRILTVLPSELYTFHLCAAIN